MKKTFYGTLLLLAMACLPARAQSAHPPTATDTPPEAITPGHRQAAESLLGIIYPPGAFDKLIDQAIVVQLKLRPDIAPFEKEMRTFFAKYMNWESLKPDLVSIYAQRFTEPELLEITRFYQTPAGRKMSATMPQMLQAGMELTQRRVQEHLPELQKAIEARMKSEQSKSAKRLHE